MSDYLRKTLEYYFEDGSHVIFDKYTIDTLGIVKSVESGMQLNYGKGKYNVCSVIDANGKKYGIRVARAVASTFMGKPETLKHTADHIKNKETQNDTLENIRWLDESGQRNNQKRSNTSKSAFIIVNDGIEKTAKNWVEYLNKTDKHKYTVSMIKDYAQRKAYGFGYKEYPDIEGEVWLSVKGSENSRGRLEISNMNRVKFVTKYASNVLSCDRLGSDNKGYPIWGKNLACHIISFKTFYPELWAKKKPEEMVLHKKDDKKDFRPHMLYLGTHRENSRDAHDNGKHDGTKTARVKCASYVDGKFEKEHASQCDAAEYLITNGYSKASIDDIGGVAGHIGLALAAFCKGNTLKRYGRTWKVTY